jgi:hypothetical protein
MAFLKAGDTISGQEGRAYATINGQVEEMFYIKTLEAKIEKEKSEIKTIGRRGTQHKTTGWSGSGSMTIYYVTSLFRQLMLDYIRTGKDTYFDITVVNDDPTSTIGKQTVALKSVNLDSTIMAKLDIDSDSMDEDIDFTFDDIDILDKFGKPVLG